jgi:hypothetical protein
MGKTNVMRRGRIEFYTDTAKPPRCPGCRTAVTHHLRCFQNGRGLDPGGWWLLSLHGDNRMPVSAGPFSTLAEADQVGRAQAARLGCRFIAATAEEIAAAKISEAKFRADAEAFANGTFVPRFD